jgi:O-antigen/teichoic acid export membrane protein
MLRRRIGHGVAFSLVAAIFNQGSTFAVNLVLAHMFGRKVFGEYAMVAGTLLPLAMIAPLGGGLAANKYVAEWRQSDPQRAGRAITLLCTVATASAALTTLAIFLGATLISGPLLAAPHLTTPLRFGVLLVLFGGVNGVMTGALAGLEAYRSVSIAGIVSGSAYLAICVTAGRVGGLTGAASGLALSAALQTFVLAAYLRREILRMRIPLSLNGMLRELEVLRRFSLPAALTGLFSAPMIWAASAILAHQAGGYTQFALYAAATNIRLIVLFVPTALINVGTSVLNHAKGHGGIADYRAAYHTVLWSVATVVVIAALLTAGIAPAAMGMFGHDFSAGSPVLLILLASTLPDALGGAMYQHILAHQRMWLSFAAIFIPRESTLVWLAFWLTPTHGAAGLATAYALSSVLAFLLIFALSRFHPVVRTPGDA